ncbi:PRTRC system protein A [Curvibacter sp. APW13]|uniref:PRTRC system protein A n=1 Tax=Curvibacter sp. APW13 TaxID=3077236 RepID=UPI0028E0503C|nr:PRTRC system protein A [Curvibacter sp. APW13]MDT8992821.1 PRTRC system protein A [Curvibacter sp. APW13]
MQIDSAILDASLRAQLPLLEIGIYAPFQPLHEPGARLLLTAHGLMLESCNGVVHAVTPLGSYDSPIRLPYGKVETGVHVIDEASYRELQAFTKEFVDIAARHAPKETLMLVVKAPGRPMRSIRASLNETTASLDYQDWVHMEEGEQILLDIHSHGSHEAFFSPTDDRDDTRFRGHLKLSCVIGHADTSQPTQAQRWVSRGHVFCQTQPARVAFN